MNQLKLLTIAIVLSVAGPSFADEMYIRRHHHHRHVTHGYGDLFLHNYGPPDFYPGTLAPPDRVVVPVNGRPYGIYDGFDRLCGQSSANYRGQDGRRHPCK
jgi:hypothetical protein